MKRRVLIFAASAIVSLAIVLATMQMVCNYVNRIYGTSYHVLPSHRVIWLVK